MAISRSKRDIGLDITRIIAFIQVPCIHFLFKIKYYNQAIVGERMYLMTFIRVMFMTCVPLFLLLTGYLSSEKKVEIAPKPLLKYYSRLVPILLTYVITAVIIIVYGIFVDGETETLGSVIRNVLDFRKYSWYIEMYIGLALMIPFLNLLWNGIGSRKGQLSLVAVMIALTVLPSVFNIYDFKTPGALIRPWLAESFTQIVPDWWKNIYPVTYYFIGAYIRRNVDMKKLKTPALFAALSCGDTAFRSIQRMENGDRQIQIRRMVRLPLASDHRVRGSAVSLHKLDPLSGCAEARVCRDRVYLEDHARSISSLMDTGQLFLPHPERCDTEHSHKAQLFSRHGRADGVHLACGGGACTVCGESDNAPVQKKASAVASGCSECSGRFKASARACRLT